VITICGAQTFVAGNVFQYPHIMEMVIRVIRENVNQMGHIHAAVLMDGAEKPHIIAIAISASITETKMHLRINIRSAGNHVEVKEGPVRFVVMALAADRDGKEEPDALALMAAMAITVVWFQQGNWHYVKGTSMKEPPTS